MVSADRLDSAESLAGLGLFFVCQMAAAAWLKVFAPDQQGLILRPIPAPFHVKRLPPQCAIVQIRRARPGTIETIEQEAYVLGMKPVKTLVT